MDQARLHHLRDDARANLVEARGFMGEARYADGVDVLKRAIPNFAKVLSTSSWDSRDRGFRLEYVEALCLLSHGLGRCWRLDADALAHVDRALVLMLGLDDSQVANAPDLERRVGLLLAAALNTRGEMLTRLEYLSEARACHTRALDVLRRFTADQRLVVQSDDIEVRLAVAQTLIGRGNASADWGDLVAAEADYQQVLEADPSLRPLGGAVARAAANLGNVLLQKGRYDDADERFSFAATTYHALEAQEWPRRLRCAHVARCRARGKFLAGRLDDAIAMAQEAASVFELMTVDGPASPPGAGVHYAIDLVMALSVLGRARTRAGDPSGAELDLEKAVAAFEKARQKVHFPRAVIAQIEVDFGNALADQGQSSRALTWYERAAEGYLTLVELGSRQHLAGLGRARKNLGNALVNQGRAEDAIAQLTDAERYYTAALVGADQPLDWLKDRAHTTMCLATAQYRVGDLQAALATCLRCVAELELLQENEANTSLKARAQVLIARIRIARGEWAEAAIACRRAEKLYKGVPGVERMLHLTADRAANVVVLGNALSERHDFARAATLYRVAIRRLRSVIDAGLQHCRPELARAHTNLGNVLRHAGDRRAAKAHLVLGADFLRASGDMAPRLAFALRCLGDCCADGDQYEEARSHYAAAYRVLEKLGPAEPGSLLAFDRAQISSKLARLYRSHGQFPAAAKAFNDVLALLGKPSDCRPAWRVEWAHAQIGHALVAGRRELPGAPIEAARSLLSVAHLCRLHTLNGEDAMRPPGMRALTELLRMRWGPSGRLSSFTVTQIADELEWFWRDQGRGRRADLRTLEHLVDVLHDAGSFSSYPNVRQPDRKRLIRLCLHTTALLMRDGEAAWLATDHTQQRIVALVERLRDVCANDRDDWLLADWFIHVFSPRASRQLLRSSEDPGLRTLAGKEDELDDLVRDLLGRTEGRVGNDAGESEVDDSDLDDPEQLEERISNLTNSIARNRRLLARSIQEALGNVISVERVVDVLASRAARGLGRDVILMLCLGPSERASQPDSKSSLPLSQRDALWVIQLSSSFANHHGAAFQRFELQSAVSPNAAPAEILSAVQPVAARQLREEIEAHLISASTHVVLIPSPELCAMPWLFLCRSSRSCSEPLGARCHVYPTISAWARGDGYSPKQKHASSIALVHDDAFENRTGIPWLPHVNWEACMSTRIWNASAARPALALSSSRNELVAADEPHGFESLLVLGHGFLPPRGSWSRAGVLIRAGHDHPCTLLAEGVRSFRARNVFINACVLGLLKARLNEALGPFAAILDSSSTVRTAIGAVRTVDDFEAALLSLSFQYRLEQCVRRGGAVTWIATFLEVQAAIHEGRWPDDFAAWLRANFVDGMFEETVISDDRILQWYGVLAGPAGNQGLIERFTAAPMRAGLRRDWRDSPEMVRADWRGDLGRVAAAIAARVPDTMRETVTAFVVLGD